MTPIRSFMFVPGNRASWIEKAPASGADALILDLEDSVPPNAKAEARALVAGKISWLAEQGQRCYVRINRSPHIYDFDDILAVVRPGLEGLTLPKTIGPEDVDCASMMVAEAEMRNGLAIGTVKIVPILETARALHFAYEIATRERVNILCGATARGADISRSLGFTWTAGGRESLYYKSRTVMAARAAGKLPIGGVWQQVHDLAGLRAAAELDRNLGMTGELCLHPSNVAILNEIYSPSEEELAYYRGMIVALDQAQAQGKASVIYEGEHIDIAHVKTARAIIAAAGQLKR